MGSGDSFTFGTVSYPENVLKIVQDSFNRHCSGRKIEIMNFSLPSAGVSEYRLVHMYEAPATSPTASWCISTWATMAPISSRPSERTQLRGRSETGG